MITMDYGDTRLPERFWDKVIPEPMSGCWLWTGATLQNGYGQISWGSKVVGVHRLMCTAVHGYPSTAKETRHTCDLRCCVNPDHLVWGTSSENKQDMLRRGGNPHASKTHCPQSHPYDETNTYRSARGDRQCRQCRRARQS